LLSIDIGGSLQRSHEKSVRPVAWERFTSSINSPQ
jgi:hypothetical protein